MRVELPLPWFGLFCVFVEIRDFGSKMKADQLRHSPGRCVRLHVNRHQSEQRPTTQLIHMIRPGILITWDPDAVQTSRIVTQQRWDVVSVND